MFTSKKLPAGHKDLIHDVSYDFYGRRLATCSSDQTVQVWDLDSDEQWKSTAQWKSHSGSVWRVTWAHPEFGQVLATCSFDRTVAIWEEQVNERKTGQSSSETHWVLKASLVDSRTSVNDVKFAPRHLGLMLATCSSDGKVRIYEAPDVMNLSQWPLMHVLSCKIGTSCLSWNPSRAHPPMIIIGTDDPSQAATTHIQIFEFSGDPKKWVNIHSIVGVVFEPVHDIAFAPNLGRTHHILAIASKDVDIIHLVPEGTDSSGHTKLEVRTPAQLDHKATQVWRVEWNVTGTILATAADDGCIRLYKANYQGTWQCISNIYGDGSVSTPAPIPPLVGTPSATASATALSAMGSSHLWRELGDL